MLIAAALVVVAVKLIIQYNESQNPTRGDVILASSDDETSDTSSSETETETETEDQTETSADYDDVTAPVIVAPSEVYISVGDTIAYKSLITVTDDYDDSPEIEVDNSNVDLTTAGSYTVHYTVTDASGNSSEKYLTLIVSEKTVETVSEDVIYAAADEILDEIIDDDMTVLEKVFAVFFHVRDSYTYTEDDTKLEYKQEAYQFIINKRDSCYANVCLAQLLLERLGYESIMANGDLGYQVRGEDQYHYWNIVSIDGGENWYVFDAAYWTWMEDEYPLCMMTADFAETISERHGGLYIYDESEYPEISDVTLWTPEELGYTSEYE